MRKSGKVLAVIFIIWGSMVTLLGMFLLLLVVAMIVEEPDSLAAYMVLAAIILGIVFLLGVLPLKVGTRRLKTTQKPEKKAVKKTVEVPRMLEIQEEKEGKPQEKKVCMERTATRILCRDKQYDNGDLPLVIFLLKCIGVTILPVALAIFVSNLISKSVGYRIQPGTWQAWASFFVVMGGSVFAVFGLWLCSRHNALGNKFYYYIIDEKDGLSFAHMGRDSLAYYVEKKATLLEKVKSTPSFLYVLIYLFGRQSRGIAIQLARMEMYFKVNRKHHFVEELLLGESYAGYCEKIVGVRKIKYFSKGCEVWLVSLKDGVEQETKQIIYRSTQNYDLLMSKIKAFESDARKGFELTNNHVKQVRRNICRRVGIVILDILCLTGIIIGSFRLYLSASYNVSVWETGVFRMLEQRIAYRSRRRIFRVIYFIIFTILAALGKMLLDAFRPNVFTYVSAEVEEYYEPKGSVLKKVAGDYRYFAKVRYGDGTVDVGLSKAMWTKKENVKPLLVLRKNIPYCLIYDWVE